VKYQSWKFVTPTLPPPSKRRDLSGRPWARIDSLIIFIFLKKIKNGNIANKQQKRIPRLCLYFGEIKDGKFVSSSSNLKKQELEE
jgi:hypothetical protein